MTTAQISEAAPAAIALLDSSGSIERATAQFLTHGADEETLARHGAELERVVRGEVDQTWLSLGTAEADLVAVVGPDGRRRVLVTVQSPGGEDAGTSNPLLSEPIDDSPAIVWLKDLEGRYLRVNRTYTARLKTDAEQVCGRTDAELSPQQSIEAPRMRAKDMTLDEPLELEYTVAAYETRPAFAVLRFAMRDGEGKPIAVCGVAAPVGEAHLARAECERLMRIERWSRLDAQAIREELLEEWDLAWASRSADGFGDPVGLNPLAVNGGVDVRAVIAAEREDAMNRFAELERELDEERRQVETEHQLVETLQGELATVESELEALRERAAQAEAVAEQAEAAAEAAAQAAAAHAAADATAAAQAAAAEAAAQAEAAAAEAAAQAEAAAEAAAAEAAARAEVEAAAADAPRWDAAAQRGLSAALEGVTEWRTALKKAVGALGTDGRWTAVVAWCPDDRRGAMKCAAMWIDGEADLAGFETRTWQHRQDVTGTEFGRARNRTGPTCLLELQAAEDPLLRAAAAEGLGSAVLLPIQSGQDTLAILELLTHGDSPPNAELTVFLEAVALQLGAYGQLLNLAMTPRWRTRL